MTMGTSKAETKKSPKAARSNEKTTDSSTDVGSQNNLEIPKPIDALFENLLLLEAATGNSDQVGVKRVLRKNAFVRRHCSLEDFKVITNLWLPDTLCVQIYEDLDAALRLPAPGFCGKDSSAMETEEEEKRTVITEEAQKRKNYTNMEPKASTSPEIEAYLRLFAVSYLLSRGLVDSARNAASELLLRASRVDHRPTLGILVARGYFLRARCAELLGAFDEYRSELIHAHRTACLQMDEYLQATLINLVLRSYCESNLIEQAAKFAAKATFPEKASNNQQVRHLYYMGRIQAIQLDYSLAFLRLTEALRKSPQHSFAHGFRMAVIKILSIVQLLMGDTPERSYFSEPALETALQPYLSLVLAVRNGSLSEYDGVCSTYASIFAQDRLSTLVLRLRSSVIRMGFRRINLSYSRISFKDIAKRLALDSPESAEFACAKAIRDNVIDATIDHEAGHLISSEMADIYSTSEPQRAFHKRIQFCLSMHNDAVKAMRYPPDAHKAKHNFSKDDDILIENLKTDEEIAEDGSEDEE